MSDNDDAQVGYMLTRREMVKLLGAFGAMVLSGCRPRSSEQGVATPGPEAQTVVAVPAQPTAQAQLTAEMATAETTNATTVPDCVARPELTEGPYFVDTQLERADIRSDPVSGVVKEGALLTLTFHVLQVGNGACTPLSGAMVDVWHCDGLGVYSGVSDPGFNTSNELFLRGFQYTDANGTATFTTIYPGWYSGRTVHIHFKIRSAAGDHQAYEFTSQLFFDEALSDEVHAQEPYAAKGRRDRLNSQDNIYNDLLLVDAAPTGEGYAGTFTIALEM